MLSRYHPEGCGLRRSPPLVQRIALDCFGEEVEA